MLVLTAKERREKGNIVAMFRACGLAKHISAQTSGKRGSEESSRGELRSSASLGPSSSCGTSVSCNTHRALDRFLLPDSYLGLLLVTTSSFDDTSWWKRLLSLLAI